VYRYRYKQALLRIDPCRIVAIFSTILVGFIGGASAIGGFLTGNITSGLLLALLMSNAGGLWDNSKKYVEEEIAAEKVQQHTKLPLWEIRR